MRGRKPKPTALKLVEGDRGKGRRKNENEPQPEIGNVPAPPEYLNYVARAEWDRVAPHLHQLGLLTEIDWAILEGYCENYGRYVDASKELALSSLTIVTDKGNVIQNPLVGIVNKAQDGIKKFAVELGMTPSARGRISVDNPNAQDDFERILNGEMNGD